MSLFSFENILYISYLDFQNPFTNAFPKTEEKEFRVFKCYFYTWTIQYILKVYTHVHILKIRFSKGFSTFHHPCTWWSITVVCTLDLTRCEAIICHLVFFIKCICKNSQGNKGIQQFILDINNNQIFVILQN